jgi:hypothetical protein
MPHRLKSVQLAKPFGHSRAVKGVQQADVSMLSAGGLHRVMEHGVTEREAEEVFPLLADRGHVDQIRAVPPREDLPLETLPPVVRQQQVNPLLLHALDSRKNRNAAVSQAVAGVRAEVSVKAHAAIVSKPRFERSLIRFLP